MWFLPDFEAVFANFDEVFANFDADFGLKLAKLTIIFHSTVRIQGGNHQFFFENLQRSAVSIKVRSFHQNLSELSGGQHEIKNHLPKKVTPIFSVLFDYLFVENVQVGKIVQSYI